jgi:hypothetical protein
MPPTRSTRPRRLISPVIAVSERTRRLVSSDASAATMRHARARAVLRRRARRHVDVQVKFAVIAQIESSFLAWLRR